MTRKDRNSQKNRADVLAEQLLKLLHDLAELHRELAMHMRNKIEAIKHADSELMQSITSRESVLFQRAIEREGLRRKLVKDIVDSLGLDAEKYGSLRVTALAERFAEPLRSRILSAVQGLKQKMFDVERVRVSTAMISNEMIGHLHEVLAVMTSGVATTDTYSRSGGREDAASANVFEVVG